MPDVAFTKKTAKRGQFAEWIQRTPAAQAKYKELGGTSDEVKRIADLAQAAKQFNTAQVAALAAARKATAQGEALFDAAEKERNNVIDITRSIYADMRADKADEQLLARVEAALKDQRASRMKKARDGGDERNVVRSQAREDVRLGYSSQANQLVELSKVAAFASNLAARNVSVDRLKALQKNLEQIQLLFAEAAARHAEYAKATEAEHEAVKELDGIWARCRRRFDNLAKADKNAASQLKGTAAKA